MLNPFLYIYTVLFQIIQFSMRTVFVYSQLNVKTVPFQAIQFSMNTQFISIRPRDRTLLGATTPGQSGFESDGNEGVLRIPQISSITKALPSNCLVSYPEHSLGKSYLSAELQLGCSTTPLKLSIWDWWFTKLFTLMRHKVVWMGYKVSVEVTREGVLV